MTRYILRFPSDPPVPTPWEGPREVVRLTLAEFHKQWPDAELPQHCDSCDADLKSPWWLVRGLFPTCDECAAEFKPYLIEQEHSNGINP